MEKIDYGTYVLTGKEKYLFYILGYIVFFMLGMLFYRSLLISSAAGLFIHALKRPYEKRMMRARQKKLLMQFKDLLYSLSASIATGRSMHEGFNDAIYNLRGMYKKDDYIMRELKMIVTGLENHESEKELLTDLAFRSRSADIAGFTDVYLTVRSSGGDMQKVISRTCDLLMDRITVERDIEKTVSQKKLEAWIITAVPIVILAGLNLLSPEYISPMYTTLAGRMIMTGCLAVMIMAYMITERITDIKV